MPILKMLRLPLNFCSLGAAPSASIDRGKVETTSAPPWLIYLALVTLTIGIFFRFYHLGWKVYGNDEATTSIRVAGYTLADYDRNALDGHVRSVAELSIYQHVTGKKTAIDTVHSLATEDPQHPPLFYLLERGWVETFGNSVPARRGLSMSACTINVALLKQEGNEKIGIYHFGMWVDDLDEAEKKVVDAGGTYLDGRPAAATAGTPANAHSYNEATYKDPFGIVFALTQTGWIGAVKDGVAKS